MTNCTKRYILRVKDDAIVCPFCKKKLAVVRLLPSAEIRDTRMRCNWCKHEIVVNVTGTSADYTASVNDSSRGHR